MYTAGVLVSGIYLDRWAAEIGSTLVLVLGLVAAVIWFLYYKLVLVEKIETLREQDGEGRARQELGSDR